MTTDPQRLEDHRTALTGHCYRMLGSASEADDAVQETMVRAWRSLERFEQRSSLRTWLVRIATNVCLDAIDDRSRRERPMDLGPAGTVDDPLETPEVRWLEPIADAHVLPADADPAELLVLRQSIRLAFVAALQYLPARQRAALLLVEVLGWSAAEVAESLEMSVAAVNSALQRARATLAARDVSLDAGHAAPAALSRDDAEVVDRYVRAFERYDVKAFSELLRQDATMSMPPFSLWLQGRDAIAAFLVGPGAKCKGSRLVPIAASGSPAAFAQYHPSPDGGFQAWALIVLDVEGGAISGWNAFLDTAALFPRFGLPLTLPA